MIEVPFTLGRLADLVEEYEEAVATAPEPTDENAVCGNTIEMIDLVVRIIHQLDEITDSFREDLAQREDAFNLRPPT